MALLRLVPIWAWVALAALIAIGVQTARLESTKTEYAEYVASIDAQALAAEKAAREVEQQRQADIEKVRTDAQAQKAKDDADADKLRATGDSLRQQTAKLLADRATLNSRLASRGKSINDLTDLLAKLRQELGDFAQSAAIAADGYRRTGMACERAYDSLRTKQ